MDFNPAHILVYMAAFLFSLSFHESAHGWVAALRGDNTAKLLGRISMNPMVHADPIGTYVMPLVGMISGWAMFGWAKPVPVNPRNFRTPEDDMFLVALAGPMSNVFLAVVGAALFGVFVAFFGQGEFGDLVKFFFQVFLSLNLALAIFNLIPLHPLDGGKILARFLPESANAWLEENQMTLNVVLIVAMIMGGLKFLAIPIAFIKEFLIEFVTNPVLHIMIGVMG